MKKPRLLATIIFFLLFVNAFSQEHEKKSFLRNQIGIQFNPYINDQLIGFRRINTVSALRYGYRITKNFTTGMEFSCNFPIYIDTDQKIQWFAYKIGLLTRYSIRSDKRFQLFTEASPYLSHYFSEWNSTFDHSPYRDNKIGFYAAPGVALYTKNKKFSFDLYYKFSNQRLINGNYSVFSYKLNYNF